MKIILLGAPGAGKGTQGDRLSRERSLPRISTGDILREAIKRRTSLGRDAESYMNAGQLVPDDTVCGIVSDRIRESDARRGFVLDGFPRTVAQAERLSAQLREDNNDIDVVIVLEVPEPVIVSRLSGRRTCSGCGASFHVELAAPKTAGSCDVCGAALVQRPDDAESAVRQRLVEYRAKTMPLVEHFRRTTPMVVVDGVGTPEDVHHQISDALERLAVGPEAE